MEGNPPTRDNSPSYKQGLRKGNLLCHAKHFVAVYEALQKLTRVNNVLMIFQVVMATTICMIRQYRVS